MTTDRDDIASLLERVKSAKGPDREINSAIEYLLVNEGKHSIGVRRFDLPNYSGSIDAALALMARLLPGWMWRLASCYVSDDAWVCPDFNHPVHGPAFKAMFYNAYGGRDPADVIIEATDVDRRPAGQPALALIEAMLLGLALLTSLKENHP